MVAGVKFRRSRLGVANAAWIAEAHEAHPGDRARRRGFTCCNCQERRENVVDEALRIVAEVNQRAWNQLKDALGDLSDDEINWRPLPQGNNINVIVRHLRIEAQWHLDSLIRGDAMPSEVTPTLQREIDAVPLDFQRNLGELEELLTGFLDGLRTTTLRDLHLRTAAAYESASAARGLD